MSGQGIDGGLADQLVRVVLGRVLQCGPSPGILPRQAKQQGDRLGPHLRAGIAVEHADEPGRHLSRGQGFGLARLASKRMQGRVADKVDRVAQRSREH